MNPLKNLLIKQSAKAVFYGYITYLILTTPSIIFAAEMYYISSVFAGVGAIISGLFFILLNKNNVILIKDKKDFINFILNGIYGSFFGGIVIVLFFVGFDLNEFVDAIFSPFVLFPIMGIFSAIIGTLLLRPNHISLYKSSK